MATSQGAITTAITRFRVTTAGRAARTAARARVSGGELGTTGIRPFGRLVGEIMKQPPYCDAEHVYWIVDNESSHRGQRSVQRVRRRYRRHPEVVLIHLPIYASWLNQIEIYFSIVQRKVLTPNDFSALREVPERLLSFQRRYEAIAQPFRWEFTRHYLATVLRGLGPSADHAVLRSAA